jgi:hypothetical protein
MSPVSAPLEAVEPIEHVVQKIGDRRERGRRGRPFPEIEDEQVEEKPPETPAPRHPEKDLDSDEHRVDLVVRGRFLPTGQDLPPGEPAPVLH